MDVLIQLPYQIRFMCAAEAEVRVHTINSVAEGEAVMAYLTGKIPVAEFVSQMVVLYGSGVREVLYAFIAACSGVAT